MEVNSGGATSGVDSGGAVSATLNQVLPDWELIPVAPYSHAATHAVEAQCVQFMHGVLYFGFADGRFGYAGRACDMLAQSFGPCDFNMCSTWHRPYMDTKPLYPSRDTYELCAAIAFQWRWNNFTQTRHISIKHFYCRELIESVELGVEFVPDKDSMADVGTNPLLNQVKMWQVANEVIAVPD